MDVTSIRFIQTKLDNTEGIKTRFSGVKALPAKMFSQELTTQLKRSKTKLITQESSIEMHAA